MNKAEEYQHKKIELDEWNKNECQSVSKMRSFQWHLNS